MNVFNDFVRDGLGRIGVKGLSSLHLTLWLLRDVLHIQGWFSPCICKAVVGATQSSTIKIYKQVRKNGQVVVFERVYKKPYLP